MDHFIMVGIASMKGKELLQLLSALAVILGENFKFESPILFSSIGVI